MPDKEVKVDISETKLNLIRDFSSEDSPDSSISSGNDFDINLSKKFDCLESSLLRSQNNVLLGIKELGKIVKGNESSSRKYSFIDKNNNILEKNQSDVFDLNESVADNLDGIEKGIGELNKDLSKKLEDVGKKDNSSLLSNLIELISGGLLIEGFGSTLISMLPGIIGAGMALYMATKREDIYKDTGPDMGSLGAAMLKQFGVPIGKNPFGLKRLHDTDTQLTEGEQKLMDVESHGGDPNATWNNWGGKKNFTTMTLNQVMAAQREAKKSNPRTRLANGNVSSAVGLGQFVEGTIKAIADDPSSGITSEDIFNRETQLKMMRYLINKGMSKKTDKEKLQYFKNTWAGLKNVDDKEILRMFSAPNKDESSKKKDNEKTLPRVGMLEYNRYLLTGPYMDPEEREAIEKKISDIENFNANKAKLLKQQENEKPKQEIQQQPQASVINAPSSTVNNTIIQKNIMPYIEDFDYMRMVAKTGSNNAFIG